MSSAAVPDTPSHQGWFSFQLTDTDTDTDINLIEFSYRQEHNIIDKSTKSTEDSTSNTFFCIMLCVHKVYRKFHIAEDNGEGLWDDDVFSYPRTPPRYPPYNDIDCNDGGHGDEVEKTLTRLLRDIDYSVRVPEEALISFAPKLSSFARGVTPVNVGGKIVRPFVLDVKVVKFEYYDQDDNEVDMMEFESLISTAPEEDQDPVDSLEKVRFDERSAMAEKCIVCYEDFTVGCEVTRLPCLHVYHENCIHPWLMTNQSCPICRYELKY